MLRPRRRRAQRFGHPLVRLQGILVEAIAEIAAAEPCVPVALQLVQSVLRAECGGIEQWMSVFERSDGVPWRPHRVEGNEELAACREGLEPVHPVADAERRIAIVAARADIVPTAPGGAPLRHQRAIIVQHGEVVRILERPKNALVCRRIGEEAKRFVGVGGDYDVIERIELALGIAHGDEAPVRVMCSAALRMRTLPAISSRSAST